MENSSWNVCFFLNFHPYHEYLREDFALLLAAGSDIVPSSAELLHFTPFLHKALSSKEEMLEKVPSDPHIHCLGCFHVFSVVWNGQQTRKNKVGPKEYQALLQISQWVKTNFFFLPQHSSQRPSFSQKQEKIAPGNICCHRWVAVCCRYRGVGLGAPGVNQTALCDHEEGN